MLCYWICSNRTCGLRNSTGASRQRRRTTDLSIESVKTMYSSILRLMVALWCCGDLSFLKACAYYLADAGVRPANNAGRAFDARRAMCTPKKSPIWPAPYDPERTGTINARARCHGSVGIVFGRACYMGAAWCENASENEFILRRAPTSRKWTGPVFQRTSLASEMRVRHRHRIRAPRDEIAIDVTAILQSERTETVGQVDAVGPPRLRSQYFAIVAIGSEFQNRVRRVVYYPSDTVLDGLSFVPEFSAKGPEPKCEVWLLRRSESNTWKAHSIDWRQMFSNSSGPFETFALLPDDCILIIADDVPGPVFLYASGILEIRNGPAGGAGWPWAVARPRLPRIRTCIH